MTRVYKVRQGNRVFIISNERTIAYYKTLKDKSTGIAYTTMAGKTGPLIAMKQIR